MVYGEDEQKKKKMVRVGLDLGQEADDEVISFARQRAVARRYLSMFLLFRFLVLEKKSSFSIVIKCRER